MKKFVAQILSLALALSILVPIPTPPAGEGTPPDEEPGISVCGDDWKDDNRKK